MAKTTDWFLSVLVTMGAAVACHSSNNATSSSNDASLKSDGGDYNTVVNLDAGPSTAVSPDGSSSCEGSCNYQTQAGCDSGFMCSPQMNVNQTVTASCQTAGTIAAGETCTWAQCQPGYLCAADGHCRHMCCGDDWSVCAANESCTGAVALLPVGGSTPVPAGVGLCEPTDDCDVLDSESCPSGQSCYIIDSRGGVKCLSTGSRDVNESCSATELCKAGLSCFVTSRR